jgi:hypothetical protein
VAQITDQAQEYQQAYAQCVLDFAVGLIPSGEPAEQLVRASEAECAGLFSKMRASHALDDLELIKLRPDLTTDDAEEMTNAFVESFRESVYEQALKNVLVAKRDQAFNK